jgi:type IV pilus assembly protein PilE
MKTQSVPKLKSSSGLTLIELLLVVVIVAVLAAIAVPQYNGYLERARRTDAKTALEQLRASQEMMRAERGRYSTDLTLVQLRNTWGGPASPSGDYNITMVATSTTFTGTATPFTGRQASDGWMAINQNGTKTSQHADRWAK